MEENKLYNALSSAGYYTKSQAEFEQQFSTPDAQDRLYKSLNESQFYTKSSDEFKTQFFGDVKKKESSVLGFGDSKSLSSTPDREFLQDTEVVVPELSQTQENLSFQAEQKEKEQPNYMGLFNKKEQISSGINTETLKQIDKSAQEADYPTSFLFRVEQLKKRLDNIPKYFPDKQGDVAQIKQSFPNINKANIDDIDAAISAVEESKAISPMAAGARSGGLYNQQLPQEQETYFQYEKNVKDTEGNAVFNQLIKDTELTKKAASMAANEGFLGGVENIVKGYYGGLGEYFADYARIREQLKANPKIKELTDKIVRISDGENIELNTEDRILAQMVLDNYNVHQELDKKVPQAYKIGGMGGTSAGFTLEFLLTQGRGSAAAQKITSGVAKAIAEGAAVSGAKKLGVGLAAKLAHAGIQTAWMPSYWKNTAVDVSKGEDFSTSVMKNYYKSFAENFSERVFMKNPWNKSVVGTVDNALARMGVNMHTDKGAVGVVLSTLEEATEEKISELMTAPVDYNNFDKFWKDYWDVKKNAEMIASVSLMTVPMGIVSQTARSWNNVQLNKIGKLLPSGIRSEIDQALDDQKLTLKEQYDLVGRIVEDHAKDRTLGDRPAEAAGNIIRYVEKKTKSNVVSAVEDRAQTPTVGTMEEVSTEDQAKVDYLESKGVKIPDGSTMAVVNDLYEKEKQKEPSVVDDVQAKQTPSDIDGAKADIEKRRQEELTENSHNRRVKEEVYEGIGVEDDYKNRYTIYTNADGSRTLQYDTEVNGEWERVNTERIPKDNTLDNETYIEKAIANNRTAKKISENNNPRSIYDIKINEKYDAELATLEQKQKEEVVSVAAEQVGKTAPKEEAIKPTEAISEPVEPLSPKEAPIVSPEQKEGLKQEFSDFYNIVQESKTSDEAFKKAQAIKNVPSDVSKAFREKYDPEETLTPKAAFDRFYEEVKQKQTKQESVVGGGKFEPSTKLGQKENVVNAIFKISQTDEKKLSDIASKVGVFWHGSDKTIKGEPTVNRVEKNIKTKVGGIIFRDLWDAFYITKDRDWAKFFSPKKNKVYGVGLLKSARILDASNIIESTHLKNEPILGRNLPNEDFSFQKEFDTYAFDWLNKKRESNGKKPLTKQEFLDKDLENSFRPSHKNWFLDGLGAEAFSDFAKEKYDAVRFGREIAVLNTKVAGFIDENILPNKIYDEYEKAQQDGSNPELVKAVEDLIGKQQNIPLQEQITEVKQVKQQENGKETSDEAQGRKEGRKEKLLTEHEEKKVAETSGVKPKNLRDVYTAGREIFGLNKVQALAQAIIVDRVVAKAAKNSGKSKQQIYSEIEFRKEDELLRSKVNTYFQAAWHGSPYQFDKFTTEKIGTGEGAQAFGWGLYFTDLRSIAEGYANMDADYYPTFNGKTREEQYRISKNPIITAFMNRAFRGGSKTSNLNQNDIEDAKKAVLNEDFNGFVHFESLPHITKKQIDGAKLFVENVIIELKAKNRNLYKVELHKGKTTEQYDWLVWDKKLTNEQIDKISGQDKYLAENLKNWNENGIIPASAKSNELNGSNLYRYLESYLGSDKEASLFLLRAGIDGIKYPAESIARGATSDTARGFNYVVFDENAVTIEEVIKFQKQLQGKRGAMAIHDGKSLVYALTDPNVSTPLHEIAHVYERYMLPSEKAAVLDWTGHKTWSVETSEKFARGFEKYLAEGVAPTEKLKAVFERFKQWLVDIYNGITGSEIDLQLNDDMSRLYDSMITGKKYTATEKKVATSVKKYTETFDDVDSLLFQDTLFQGEYKTERHTKAINNLIDNFEKAGNKDIATAVTNYLQERGNPVSEEIVNNVLKQRGHAKGTGKGTEKTGQQTQGVESGKEGRLRVRDNEKNGVEAQKGEGIKQKISQHYKKLVDGKSGVSAKTREILINKDGAYDVITKASLNSFADELIGSVLADGVDGLDMLFEDLKQAESKLIPSNLTGATIVLSYKLAYQYERLGEFDKAAEVDMWRKKMGTELGQMLSAFDEMSGIPEERIRQLRGELLADREAKLEQTGTTGKKISEEISDVQGELNEEAIKALKEENEQLRKKIKDILNANAPKGDVKAKPTLLSKEKSKALADKIRSFKIKEDKLMAADPLTAAYVITRNGTLSLVAEIVEQTGNVSEAISKGIKALRDSEWYKNLNKSEQTVYENKYRTFLKDEFGLSNQFNLEQINIEGLTEEVLGIVNDHWTKLKKQEKSLETKLIEAGLDTKTAQKVAQTAKELVYDYIKENGLTNIKKLFQEKSTTTARKKIKETASQTILNMIREGAVTSDGLVDALADFYGYGNVGFELLDKAAKIANEAASMKPGIRKTMLLEQFEDIIYELDHGTAKKVYDFINSLYNTSILSAPTTTSRAAKGMFLTGLWHFINATVSNPLAAVRGGLRHFGRGAWAGVRVMPNAIATGVGNINVADTPTHTDAIRKIVNKSLSQTWQELKDATEKPNNKKEVIAKTTNLMAKVWFYLPVKMYRTLLALDVPMKTGLIEYEAFIKEYNDAMSTKDGISISRKLSEINKKLGRDNKTIRNMKVEIENEMAEMKKNGERIPKNYAIIREFELMELMRDTETVETARRLAEQALLMNTPEGVATGAMYHLLSMVTKPTAVKVETKDPKTGKVVTRYKVSPQMAAATLAMKFMFPIIRVPANFLRTAAGATPLGLVRALNKTVPTLEGKKRYERTKSNDERIRQATAGAIGTTIGMALAAMMFDYDDDDKTLKLSKDAPIKITLNGTGDDTKNKSISKNYQKLAINFARPDWAKTTAGRAVWDVLMGEDEEWSDPFSYVDNPLGMILAPLGYVSDKLRYEQPEVDEDGNVKPVFDGNIDLFWSMAYNAAAFGTSQSYMQSANDLINLIPQSRKEVPASFNADVYNFVNRPVTALFSPNLYQWAEKQYRAAAGVSEKEYTGMLSNMARLIPSLEDEFSGERTDQFGYPVVREFQIPLVPDAVTSSIDEWKMDKKRMNTDDWKLILSREKVVLPRSWKAADKSLDVYKDEDLNLAEEKAKVAFRDRVLNSIDYLRSLDDDILQKEINFLRQEGINEALIWLETDGRKK